MRWRVAVVVPLIVLTCALPLAYLQAVAFDRTPMDVLGQTGQFLLAAVPIAALAGCLLVAAGAGLQRGAAGRRRWRSSACPWCSGWRRPRALARPVLERRHLPADHGAERVRAAAGDAGHRAAARAWRGPDDVRRPAGVQPGAAGRVAADQRAGDDQGRRRAGVERGPDGRLHPAGAADRLGGVAVPGGDGARVRDQARRGQRAAGQRVVGDVRVRLRDRLRERERLVVAAAAVAGRVRGVAVFYRCAATNLPAPRPPPARCSCCASSPTPHARSGSSIAPQPGGDGLAPSR